MIFICGASIAQTETTKWYIEGELYDTTSCESGDDITMPQVPERFGYTFSGWEPAVYDMSTLDASINGTSCSIDGKKWKMVFPYGAVYGEGLCSSTSGMMWYPFIEIDTQQDSGQNCWCHLTEFVPTGSKKIYGPTIPLFVFEHKFSQTCGSDCSRYCINLLCNNSTNRRQLYGIN